MDEALLAAAKFVTYRRFEESNARYAGPFSVVFEPPIRKSGVALGPGDGVNISTEFCVVFAMYTVLGAKFGPTPGWPPLEGSVVLPELHAANAAAQARVNSPRVRRRSIDSP